MHKAGPTELCLILEMCLGFFQYCDTEFCNPVLGEPLGGVPFLDCYLGTHRWVGRRDSKSWTPEPRTKLQPPNWPWNSYSPDTTGCWDIM